ncbi:hypothetical protein NQ317_018728 [Molorchus minor]|uniref:Uncharacterized protein n=1 Tax=Molorchus minor TaxID=1323400 RepID=A0ABQ9JTK5_9CUCU|nr:hypothetical protein NQ317_018728 [Molorchus minor]
MPSLHHIPHNDSFLEHIEESEGQFNRSVSSATVQNIKSQHRERKISMPVGDAVRKGGYGSKHNVSSNLTLHAVPEKQNVDGAMDMFSQSRLPNSKRKPRRSTSTSSFQYVSTAYHGSTLTLQPETFASSFSLRSSKVPDAPKLLDISIILTVGSLLWGFVPCLKKTPHSENVENESP